MHQVLRVPLENFTYPLPKLHVVSALLARAEEGGRRLGHGRQALGRRTEHIELCYRQAQQLLVLGSCISSGSSSEVTRDCSGAWEGERDPGSALIIPLCVSSSR